MLKLLSLISKNFIIPIPVSLLLGFAFGLVAPSTWLKNLIIPLTCLMVYPMMVSLKLAKVLEGGVAMAQVLAQVINFAIIPFIAFALGLYFSPISRFTPWGCCLRPCCRPAA